MSRLTLALMVGLALQAGARRVPVTGGTLAYDEAGQGPAVILQRDSTTLVPPSCAARLDEAGNLVIDTGAHP